MNIAKIRAIAEPKGFRFSTYKDSKFMTKENHRQLVSNKNDLVVCAENKNKTKWKIGRYVLEGEAIGFDILEGHLSLSDALDFAEKWKGESNND